MVMVVVVGGGGRRRRGHTLTHTGKSTPLPLTAAKVGNNKSRPVLLPGDIPELRQTFQFAHLQTGWQVFTALTLPKKKSRSITFCSPSSVQCRNQHIYVGLFRSEIIPSEI